MLDCGEPINRDDALKAVERLTEIVRDALAEDAVASREALNALRMGCEALRAGRRDAAFAREILERPCPVITPETRRQRARKVMLGIVRDHLQSWEKHEQFTRDLVDAVLSFADAETRLALDYAGALRTAVEHMAQEIEGQVRHGPIQHEGYETRMYWLQVAGVGREAATKLPDFVQSGGESSGV